MRARGSRVLAWGLGVGGGNNKVTFDFAEGPVISTPREKGNQVAHPPCDAATATGEPAEPLLPSPRWARCLRLLALGNQVVHLPGEGV